MDKARAYVAYFAVLVIIISVGYPSLVPLVRGEDSPVRDFGEYWSAGRLNLRGGNPYDQVQLLSEQGNVPPSDALAFRFQYPPWVLPLVTPFSLLPYPLARALGYLVEMCAYLLCAMWLWQHYGGNAQQRGFAVLMAAGFVPALDSLLLCQITVLALVGITAFLHFVQRRNWLWAGVAAGVAAVKPQILYLFWVCLLFWTIKSRKWRALLGFLAAILAMSIFAMLPNRGALSQYIDAFVHDPPADWLTPTIGTFIRLVFAPAPFWLQYLPCVVGLGWMVVYWRRHSAQWDWSNEIPLLILVSLLTMPYGWYHDAIIALPAMLLAWVTVATGRSRKILLLFEACYIALNVPTLFIRNSHWFIWLFPVLLGLYLLATRHLGGAHSPVNAGLRSASGSRLTAGP